jgi:hypothetical protein
MRSNGRARLVACVDARAGLVSRTAIEAGNSRLTGAYAEGENVVAPLEVFDVPATRPPSLLTPETNQHVRP